MKDFFNSFFNVFFVALFIFLFGVIIPDVYNGLYKILSNKKDIPNIRYMCYKNGSLVKQELLYKIYIYGEGSECDKVILEDIRVFKQ